MESFLQQYGQTLGIILAVVYVLFAYDFSFITGKIKSGLARLSSRESTPVTVTGMTTSQRSLDEQEYTAAIMLAERARRRKCPECDQAIRTYLAHWLDDNTPVEG